MFLSIENLLKEFIVMNIEIKTILCYPVKDPIPKHKSREITKKNYINRRILNFILINHISQGNRL